MADTILALDAGPVPRPRSQMVATGFAVAGFAMMMAGALGWYMALRHASVSPGHDWIPDGVAVPNPQFDYALLTLVVSVITAHWAVYASRRGERGHTWLAIAVTIVMGLGFINMVIFSMNRMEIEIGSGQWQNLAFAITGLALALVVIGLFYLGLMALRSLGGSMGRDGTAPLSAAVFFWDFVVIAWTATWYAIYVVK
jgi:heme/copper-type cytochrome/quinol oxidase subunit 3